MIDTKTLRKRIIDLAISGKLNEATEKSASDELEKIITALGNSTQRDILDDEKWTDIPANWTWARLADLTTNDTLNDGNWVLSEDMVPDGEVKLIQLGSIGDCEYRFKGFKYLTEKHFKELNGRQIYPGYLLINRLVVDRMLSCIIPDIKGILITAVDVCWVAPNDDYYSIEYLMYVMSSSGIQQRVQELGHGVTRFRISKLNLIDIAFPLPPLDEQRQIVSTINELYGILNRIDNLQEKYRYDLATLKSKIIDAGIRGKLTEQLPEDGDAKDLYAQIQEKKAKLIKEGKIKKQETKPTIDDIPFAIPENWKWIRIGDIEEINLGFTYRPEYVDEGVYFLSAKDITGGKIDFSNAKKVSEETYEKAAYGSKPRKGDVLFCRVGTLGKPQVLYDDVKFCIFVSLGFFRDHYNMTDPEYVALWMNSKLFEKQVDFEVKGALQRNLNTGWLKEFLFPMPPLSEQKRIVSKVDALLEQMNL